LRIAFVDICYYRLGGGQVVMLSEMEYLKKLGHEVFIFSIKDDKNLPSEYSEYFIEKDYLANKKQKGLSLDILDKFYYIMTNIHNNNSARKFEKFIKDVKPDIIHIHNYSRYFTPAIYEVAKKYNISVVSTEHSNKLACPANIMMKGKKQFCKEMHCTKGNYLNAIKHKCLNNSLSESLVASIELGINKSRYIKNTAKFIVPSKYLENVLKISGVPSEKIVYLPNFVDLSKFTYTDKIGDYFLYYGRLGYEKGLMTLIKAFEQLPGVSLKIVGKGSEEDVLKNYVKSKNIRNIEFIGEIDFNNLVNLIQNSKATILPSECGEIFGLTVVESFACGKSVIGADVGGITELISNDVGYIFKSGCIDDLRDKICKINSKNNEELLDIGLLAKRKVEENYTLEKHGNNLIQLYKSL